MLYKSEHCLLGDILLELRAMRRLLEPDRPYYDYSWVRQMRMDELTRDWPDADPNRGEKRD